MGVIVDGHMPTIRQRLGHVVIAQVNPPAEGRFAGLILLRPQCVDRRVLSASDLVHPAR